LLSRWMPKRKRPSPPRMPIMTSYSIAVTQIDRKNPLNRRRRKPGSGCRKTVPPYHGRPLDARPGWHLSPRRGGGWGREIGEGLDSRLKTAKTEKPRGQPLSADPLAFIW
jgi:hypothetical protein